MPGVVELIDRAVELPPGPRLSALLAGLSWSQIPNARLVEVMQAHSRQLAHAQAGLLAGLAEVARAVPVAGLPAEAVARAGEDFEWASHEIAAGLTWTPAAADRELDFARVLVRGLPLVFAALERGLIDRGKAWVFAEHLDPARGELTAIQIRRLCERFVPLAPGLTSRQLSRRLLRAIQAIDPEFHRRRYRRGLRERGVVLVLDRDGTATLSGEGLPPDEAAAAAARLDRLAEAVKRAGHPGRLAQISADLYLGMLDGSFHGLTEAEILARLLARPRPEDTDERAEAATDSAATDSSATETNATDAAATDATDAAATDATDAAATDATDAAATDATYVGEPDTTDAAATDSGLADSGSHDAADPDEAGPIVADAVQGAAIQESAGQEPSGEEPGGEANASEANGDEANGDEANGDEANGDEANGDEVGAGEVGAAEKSTEEQPAGERPVGAGSAGAGEVRRWGERPGIREGIELRVGLATLLGCDQRPAEIPGLGPVDAEIARAAVARQRRGAQWQFALVDPRGYLLLAGPLRRRPRNGGPPRDRVRGGVVELYLTLAEMYRFAADPDLAGGWGGVVAEIADRWAGRYRLWRRLSRDPRARFARGALARHVRVRDRTCVGPGCDRPARRSDLDHTWDHVRGGATVEANIGPGCWRHHPDKDRGWTLTQPRPGRFVWISPLGRTYRTRGEPVRPDLPDPDPPPKGTDLRANPEIERGWPLDLRILWRKGRTPDPPDPPVPEDETPP